MSGCALIADLTTSDGLPSVGETKLSATTPTGVASMPVSAYDIGLLHFQSMRYGLALDSFRKDLRHNAQSVRTLNAVAATYDFLGRTDLADRYYEEALALNPDSAQTLNNLGYSYLMRGRQAQSAPYLAEAERLFRLARGRDGGNPKIDANLSYLADIRGDLFGVRRNLAQVPDDKLTIVAKAPDPYAAWVERKSSDVHYLVSSPPPALARKLRELRVDPAIASSASLALKRASRPPMRKATGPRRAIEHVLAALPKAKPNRTKPTAVTELVAVLPRAKAKPNQAEPTAVSELAVVLPRAKPHQAEPETTIRAAATPKSKPRPDRPLTVRLATLIQPRPKAPVMTGQRGPDSVPLSGPGGATLTALDNRPVPRSPLGTEPLSNPGAAREMQVVAGPTERPYRVIVAEQRPQAAPLIASIEGQ
jgi:hypothetical protein